MTRDARICGVVLAAGAGRRMGRPKAELTVDGERLVDRAVALLTAAGCHRICVVARTALAVPAADVVVNEHPGRGMRSSLALGVSAAADPVVDAVAVVLVDLPGLTVAGTTAVLEAWRPGRIALARYGTRTGHPTVMSPEMWQRALALAGPDEGARALLAAEPGLVDAVDVPGDPTDLDTPADLDAWHTAQKGRARPR